MDAGRATNRVESVGRRARVLHRCVPSSARFGSVRFGSVRFVRSRHVVSVAFATKSAQSLINRRAVRFVRVASRAWCVTHRV